MANKQLVWDLPVRVFHWALVVAVIGALITGKIGGDLMVWHGRAGLVILGLIVFRLLWGFVGTPTARFSHFLSGPTAIVAYLKGEWRGVGHNPIGAWSVLALLGVLATQALTGLGTDDEIAYQGPWAERLGEATSALLGSLHKCGALGLYGLLALHVVAIVFYLLIKKQNLVKPMLTGWQDVAVASAPDASRAPQRWAWSFSLSFLLASAAVVLASGIWAR